MSAKEKAPTGAATSAGAAGVETHKEAISNEYFSTAAADRQGGRIWELLPAGETSAIPADDLAMLAEYSNTRSLRAAVDGLRSKGVPILATQSGYFRPSPGPAGIGEIRRFLRRQDARAASNRRTTHLIRAQLRALEKAPLDGQETMWGGGADG